MVTSIFQRLGDPRRKVTYWGSAYPIDSWWREGYWGSTYPFRDKGRCLCMYVCAYIICITNNTFDRVALYKCIASSSSRTSTNSHVAHNLTNSVGTTRIYTWIYAALSYASFIHGAVWTDGAFGATFEVWVTTIFELASTNTIIANCIWSTRWGIAWITRLGCCKIENVIKFCLN